MAVAGSSSEATDSDRRDVPSSMVERMTLIMDTFDGRNSRRTLEDIVTLTRLPRSTAHRILDQLVRLHWLNHTSSGYALGKKALSLAGRDGGHSETRQAALPLLYQLQARTGLVAHLAVLEDAEVYYLDKISSPSAVSVPSRVGGRAPAHATALGKAVLAWLEPEAVDAMLRGRISRLTSRTIVEMGTLHQELHRIRNRRGLSFEREEYCPGIVCVAAAIWGQDEPLAAISLAGDIGTSLEKFAPLVVSVAQQVSQALCSEGQHQRTPYQKSAQSRRQPRHEPKPSRERFWSPETMDRLIAMGQTGTWL